jgi:PLP dependent protein
MISEKLNTIKAALPSNVMLVAVSKTKPVSDIRDAYDAGHRDFGENKVQELTEKHEKLPPDIRWHMIGHLQTNKVKFIAPFISLIHSVDKRKLLKVINKEAEKAGRIIPCLLQFHIAEEESKFGLSYEEAANILLDLKSFPHVRINGVMGMATFTDDQKQVRKEFKNLKKIFDRLKMDFFQDNENFKEISMGMSNDYQMAIDEGTTIIRIGSAIFGERNYSQK